MWLPLALADVYGALVALARVWAANPGKVNVPTRAETLRMWALPMLASSLEASEREREAAEQLAVFERIKKMVQRKKS